MKRADLLKRIARASKRRGHTWSFVRPGAEHHVYRCGEVEVSIPRHREIGEGRALDIVHDLQDELGKGWWRR